MKTGKFWQLGHISDAGLRNELSALLRTEARTEARVVAHLAEIDRRKLYLKDGYSCLFNYCQGQLGLSENLSSDDGRQNCGRYPIVFGMLELREIHLSGLCLLRDFLTPENHAELLRLASGQSKRRLMELLAARFPGESAAPDIRKLPTGRVTPLLAAPTRARRCLVSPSKDEPSTESPLGRPSTQALFDPVTGEMLPVASEAEALAHSAAAETEELSPPRALPASLSDVRYRIQFDASSALKAKLELARALSSHSNPRGDLETLFERALDAYVERLQKRRFAKVERPRAQTPRPDPPSAEPGLAGPGQEWGSGGTRSESGSESASALETGTGASSQVRFRSQASRKRHWPGRRSERRKHLSHDTRRAVVQRDGLRCSFVAVSGKRCDEQAFLQFDHEQLWALWSSDEPDNLRILCAFHNRWLAERELGAEYVARRIAERSAGASSLLSTLVRADDRVKNREDDVRKPK